MLVHILNKKLKFEFKYIIFTNEKVFSQFKNNFFKIFLKILLKYKYKQTFHLVFQMYIEFEN